MHLPLAEPIAGQVEVKGRPVIDREPDVGSVTDRGGIYPT
jgi:hypothetical protein